MTYKPKACVRCLRVFDPASSTQEYCKPCGKERKRERTREYHREYSQRPEVKADFHLVTAMETRKHRTLDLAFLGLIVIYLQSSGLFQCPLLLYITASPSAP